VTQAVERGERIAVERGLQLKDLLERNL
jgi:hypothetical protein